MAIDTKTTAGGVVILFLSGTGGYLATNAVNGETTAPTTSLEAGQTRSGNPEERQPALETREEQNVSPAPSTEGRSETSETVNTPTDQEEGAAATSTNQAGDSVALTPERSQVQNDVATTQPKQEKTLTEIMKEKITESNFESVNEDEEDCKTALNKTYSKENFETAVLTCFKTKTFKNRVDKLGIELIDNASEGQRFRDLGEPALTVFAQKTKAENIPTIDQKTTSSSIPVFCQKVGDLTWSSINNNNYPIDKEWEGYLKVCAKDNNVSKNFWTGK